MFEFDTTNCFTIVSNKISKVNYLIWAGLCHSVPKHVKNSNCLRSEISLILTINNKEFDILEKKSKDYYMLIKRIIAQCPKNSKHLCQDFNLTQDQLKKVFLLTHEVAFEPYLKAFQYKVLNSILFTIKSYAKCVVPENIQTPTTEGIENSRGLGGSEAQEIPEGRGVGP